MRENCIREFNDPFLIFLGRDTPLLDSAKQQLSAEFRILKIRSVVTKL